ncbi:DUF3987 domain-containing protein [Bremerella alba]|uniref:DNA primase/polymerase bifunctional N-terminal domain-containing protein n=1 Tax=Bremerella alba TaxID=980252 RepID=A0A7V8V8C1_9BACT|nr:DUF3987 domain-containing protein [Bremerella alba]MBA2116832.1 hypothetical protein [Bremerella alba]
MTQTLTQLEVTERVTPDNVPEDMRAAKQWVLWRYEERGGKPTKVPYQVNGKPASSTDPTHWVTFGEILAALEDSPEASGIGFVFTPEDNFIGIDLDDCRNPVTGQLTPWSSEIVERFGTYTEVSPSGKGLKLFLRGQFPLDRGRKVNLEGGGAVEVYTKGRYFTVTGQRLEGFTEVAEVDARQLAVFADRYFLPQEKPEIRTDCQPSDTPYAERVSRAQKYISAIPGAVSGQGGHDDTFRVACLLVNGFELDESSAMTILQGWNLTCQPPWTQRELDHKVRSAVKAGANGDRGYMLQVGAEARHEVSPDVDTSHIEAALNGGSEDEGEKSTTLKPSETMPAICLEPPGLIGEVYRYIMRSALYPSPEVALAAAIAFVSVIVCRKVVGFRKATPNLYLMAIAPSGAGKDHPRKVVREILGAAGGTHLIGPESFTSGSAIVESLSHEPAFVSLVDEIGYLFKAISGDRASTWLQEIGTNLLKVWGEGRSIPWRATARADAQYNREVNCPQPVVFGTTTPLVWGHTTESIRDDGLLARFLVLQAYNRSEIQGDLFDESDEEIPASIIERSRSWIELKNGGNLNDQFPTFFKVPFTENAKAAYRQFWDETEEAIKEANETTISMLDRSRELVSRLSVIAACACHDPANGLEGLVIEVSHVEWAIAIAKRSTEIKIYETSRHIAESSHHKSVLKVKRIIQDAGKSGLTKTQLTNKTQWVSRQIRNDIIQGLLEGGDIVAADEPTGKRPKTVYRAV